MSKNRGDKIDLACCLLFAAAVVAGTAYFISQIPRIAI